MIGTDPDTATVRAMARGDQQALGRLYDRHADRLFVIAVSILRDRAEAEDLVHDVFLEAWRDAARFDPARGRVATWLGLITRSRALDIRKLARVARTTALDAVALSTDGAVEPALRNRLRRLVATLPPLYRELVRLRYVEGQAFREAAATLGIPIGTAKSRTFVALERLRACAS